MEAPDPLEVLLDELRRLRADGVETVPVSQESLEILRGLVDKASASPANQAATLRVSANPAPAPVVPAPQLSEPATPAAPVAPKRVAQAPRVDDSAIPQPPQVDVPGAGSKAERLAALERLVQACPECQRHLKPCRPPVFGVGNPDAEIVFVGEVPGEEDEAAGRPFLGPNGELLDRAIKAMGLSREQVYLAHVMKWRTTAAGGFVSRTPTARELAFCAPYLRAQLAVIRPKVVVALGGTVFHALTGDMAKISEVRGQWREVDGLPLIPTFHPSYLLKNPSNTPKRQFWEDLLAVMEKADLPISERQRAFFR